MSFIAQELNSYSNLNKCRFNKVYLIKYILQSNNKFYLISKAVKNISTSKKIKV